MDICQKNLKTCKNPPTPLGSTRRDETIPKLTRDFLGAEPRRKKGAPPPPPSSPRPAGRQISQNDLRWTSQNDLRWDSRLR